MSWPESPLCSRKIKPGKTGTGFWNVYTLSVIIQGLMIYTKGHMPEVGLSLGKLAKPVFQLVNNAGSN